MHGAYFHVPTFEVESVKGKKHVVKVTVTANGTSEVRGHKNVYGSIFLSVRQ